MSYRNSGSNGKKREPSGSLFFGLDLSMRAARAVDLCGDFGQLVLQRMAPEKGCHYDFERALAE